MMLLTVVICLIVQLIFSIFILIESNSIHREFYKLPIEHKSDKNQRIRS